VHANASRSHGAKGSEVYFLSYQATDEESRRLALAEGGAIGAGAGVAEGSDLALILWDMAQAQHLEASSALATRIQEELADVTGSQGRGIKQAPFRVLVGAAMPAVLLEVAFISNPDEEKLLVSEAYQNKVVGAVVRGVARYQQQRASLDVGGAAPAPR
jgi:N-acetylmuramoyl-L-alanine amidase